jgi:hypothetical protein
VAEGKAWRRIPSRLAQAASALDADSGKIVAHTLTDQDTGVVSQVAPLPAKVTSISPQLAETAG